MNRLVPSILLSAFATCVMASPGASVAIDAQVGAGSASDHALIAKDHVNDRFCVRDTGTRIKHRGHRECLAVNGRSYSRDDIDRTGAVDLADALQRLDPSISMRR